MRMAKVPIDMASEQKNLMGVVSTRQALYIGGGILIIYSYVPIVFSFLSPLFGWIAAIVVCAILALPIIAVVAAFSFFPVAKYHMNRDMYILMKLQRNTQVGLWRKGE